MERIGAFLAALILFGVAALVSLLLTKFRRASRIASGILGMIAAAVGCIAAVQVFAGGPLTFELPGPAMLGHFVLRLDALSAFMALMISVLSFATSLYSIAYLQEYDGRGTGPLGFFNNLFIAAMLMVVSVGNAFYFLIFWELMTLTSYFLVIFEHEKKESVSAGYLYFLIAHIGTALIMIAFLVLYRHTGSFDFSAFRSAGLPPGTQNLVFLLAFLGFGAKAGIVPLHVWLPRAHPAAPSHASALLSGVMIKTAVYGIIRICVDVLPTPAWWWGFVVLVFGAGSALLGILYALDERDIKRLLAYSSVENIGIILMGAGVGMVGLAIKLPLLATMGFLAALYHAINHAMFKGLLFMGAGAVIRGTHTHDMNQMGGLARLMPWTSVLFLTGAISIAAIPPLNGFVSEWILYQSLFIGSTSNLGALRVLGPMFAMLLGLVGALVVMCFVKAYGSTFTGPPRSPGASSASEVPGLMLAGMAVPALGAVFLGLGAPLVTPFIGGIVATITGAPTELLAGGTRIFASGSSQATLSTPFIFLLLAALLALPLLAVFFLGGFKAGQKTEAKPWACGYGYQTQMGVGASNFAQPMILAYGPLYGLRPSLQRPLEFVAALSRRVRAGLTAGEPLVETAVSRPLRSSVQYVGRQIQRLQMGDVRIYCLYIFVALAVLLVVIFR